MQSVVTNIRVMLGQLSHVGVIDDEATEAISQILEKELLSWQTKIAEELRSRIQGWEALEGGDPVIAKAGSLYTLGLRQALDLVVEEKPLEEPPVLETDTEVEIGNGPPDEDG